MAATPTNAAAQNDDIAVTDRDWERIEAALAREELVWLRAHDDTSRVATSNRGAVYAVGFFREDEISDDLLDKLSENLLDPTVLAVFSGTERLRPLVRVFHEVPGHPGMRCVSLVQIVRGRSLRSGDDNSQALVQEWANHIPARMLTPECNLGDYPPMPEGFLERQEFEVDGPVLREGPRSCDDFPPLEPQHIDLIPGMRIDFRAIMTGDTMPRTTYHLPGRHIEFFGRGFGSALYRAGLGGVESMPYGNYAPRDGDLTIELRLIEDAVADAFCYVADIAQGSSKQRFTLRIPREGQALRWNNPGKPNFNPSPHVLNFGTQVAEQILSQQ